jgi:uncharacterized protein with HEPN domain
MRREDLYLADIVDAADAIARSVHGRSFDDFVADDDVRDSILYRLIIIGEAVSHLPASVRQRYPDIPWRAVTGFRNRAVHSYFAMDWDIVWNTATESVPLLRRQVGDILSRDYPGITPSNDETEDLK